MSLHVSNNLEKFCLSVILRSCPFVSYRFLFTLWFFLYILCYISEYVVKPVISVLFLSIFYLFLFLLLALLMLLLLYSLPNSSGSPCHLLFGLLFKTLILILCPVILLLTLWTEDGFLMALSWSQFSDVSLPHFICPLCSLPFLVMKLFKLKTMNLNQLRHSPWELTNLLTLQPLQVRTFSRICRTLKCLLFWLETKWST